MVLCNQHIHDIYRCVNQLRFLLFEILGTKSTVLTGRYQDSDDKKGFENWKFMSVHFWGEDPKGTWKFHVRKNQYDEVLIRL